MASQSPIVEQIAKELETVQGVYDAMLDMEEKEFAFEIDKVGLGFNYDVQNAAGHAWPLATEVSTDVSALATPRLIRLVAGQVSKLTLTGLDGWQVLSARLSLSNVHGLQAVPFDAPAVAATDHGLSVFNREEALAPPRQVHQAVVNLSGGQGVLIHEGTAFTRIGGHYDFMQSGTATVAVGRLAENISSVSRTEAPGQNQIVTIETNEPLGVTVSTAEDRVLHRVPQALAKGQVADLPDLAAAINEGAKGGDVTLNILAQSNGVLTLSGSLTRRRHATGFVDPAPVPDTALSNWAPLIVTPAGPPGNSANAVTTLAVTARVSGPVVAGLRQAAAVPARVVLRPHARLHVAQPFNAPVAVDGTPLAVSGLWLFAAAPPEEVARIAVALTEWDASTGAPGAIRAAAQAELPPGQSDYDALPGGLFARWVPFEDEVMIDPPDQGKRMALELSQASGPVALIEAPLSLPTLQRALYRDVRRSNAWSARRFGAAQKALMFELGMPAQSGAPARLTVSSAGGTAHLLVPSEGAGETVTSAPHGPLTLSANAALTLDEITAETATPQQEG